MPFPSPGDLPDPGIELMSLMSPALAGGFFTTSTTLEWSDALGVSRFSAETVWKTPLSKKKSTNVFLKCVPPKSGFPIF